MTWVVLLHKWSPKWHEQTGRCDSRKRDDSYGGKNLRTFRSFILR